MSFQQRKFLYISNVRVDDTVFQTQVLDWLHLFNNHSVRFQLIQVFHIKDLLKINHVRRQITYIRQNTTLPFQYFFFFPSKSMLYVINSIRLFLTLMFTNQEIVIFSRALIGKEVVLLKRILREKVIFYFDARGASAEENKYLSLKKGDFSFKRYKMEGTVHYLEYRTLISSDKIFVVSQVLKSYFKRTYNLVNKKFVEYPCLSDTSKFFYDPGIREDVRHKLNIANDIKVLIYSGGIDGWHMFDKLLNFLDYLLKHEKNAFFLCLTKDILELERLMKSHPETARKSLGISALNSEVFKYLNAADYGILFRANTLTNNVASPTKYAEYILCGLPVLISEDVGDYSNFTSKYNLGTVLKEDELITPQNFDRSFLNRNFDRSLIAEFGRKHLSKDSIIDELVSEFLMY